jgi:WD40 repeat protein
MNSRIVLVLAVSSGYLAHAQQPSGGPGGRLQYSAAFLSTNLAAPDPKLTVFPFEGQAFSILLPIAVSHFAFTSDGKTMYGSRSRNLRSTTPPDPDAETLYKIEFNPIRASPVRGSAGMRPIYGVAVYPHGEKIVVVAGVRAKLGCGIFEIDPFDGTVREVVFEISCQPPDALSHWSYLNVSPDGKLAAAYRRHKLEIIDLANGTIRQLGERFMEAAWSPDGKWLAGLEAKWSGRTILMDPTTWKERRTLPQSQCQWSPDSRYILQDNGGSLKAINVATGQASTIVSSKDKVSEVTTAWVSSDIRP